MSNSVVEPISKTTDSMTKNVHAAEKIAKDNTDAVHESGVGSSNAFMELTRACQELSTKNAKNLTSAIQALSTVKNPGEYIELQQKLIKDGVEELVHDSQHLAHLTAAIFSSAFEPMKRQFESSNKMARN